MADIDGFVKDVAFTRGPQGTSQTFFEVIDGEVIASTLQPPIGGRVLRTRIVANAGDSTKWYAFHQAHSTISGYERLSTSNLGELTDEKCTAAALANCAIEEYATLAGNMNDVIINTVSTMDWSITAKKDPVSTNEVHIELKIFHRTTGGTETLIATIDTPNVTTSYVIYTGTWSVSSQVTFGSNEILVGKYRNFNTGTPT